MNPINSLQQSNSSMLLSVEKLLGKNLVIPNYQRPYKWTERNITDLLLDIQKSIEDHKRYPGSFKYRVGTIILHEDKDQYEIVDGQQRVLSFVLLKLCLNSELNSEFSCSLLNQNFTNKDTQKNLYENYKTIREWLLSLSGQVKNEINKALADILEVVVITVSEISEAFQLFDSQNSRGKALYPHDLLKAYHLREIHDKYDMQNAVVKWESKQPKEIRELFDLYLFPLWNWSKRRKSGDFSATNIDIYKGIGRESTYTYARRANNAMPYFLITEPFIAGVDFFAMVEHYMQMLQNIKEEIDSNKDFDKIKKILEDKSFAAGMTYARNLFYCALFCYYDRFHNFDIMAVKKLFVWAMMVRVDMQSLGFDTINRYAIGLGDNDKYSNALPVISMITTARKHTDISSMRLNMKDKEWAETNNKKWSGLAEMLKNI